MSNTFKCRDCGRRRNSRELPPCFRRTKYKSQRRCKVCKAKFYKPRTKALRRNNPEWAVWCSAKRGARARGIGFKLKKEDVQIPKRCPVLGIPLEMGVKKFHAGSPTLDRINSKRGYVKGNVWVISHRANMIKSNATLAELKLLVKALEEL